MDLTAEDKLWTRFDQRIDGLHGVLDQQGKRIDGLHDIAYEQSKRLDAIVHNLQQINGKVQTTASRLSALETQDALRSGRQAGRKEVLDKVFGLARAAVKPGALKLFMLVLLAYFGAEKLPPIAKSLLGTL